MVVPNLADGKPHTVSITYTPACPTCSPTTPATIDVILDAVDMFRPGSDGFERDRSDCEHRLCRVHRRLGAITKLKTS